MFDKKHFGRWVGALTSDYELVISKFMKDKVIKAYTFLIFNGKMDYYKLRKLWKKLENLSEFHVLSSSPKDKLTAVGSDSNFQQEC